MEETTRYRGGAKEDVSPRRMVCIKEINFPLGLRGPSPGGIHTQIGSAARTFWNTNKLTGEGLIIVIVM